MLQNSKKSTFGAAVGIAVSLLLAIGIVMGVLFVSTTIGNTRPPRPTFNYPATIDR